MNLKPTTVGADSRQRFAGASSGATALNPSFGNVIRTRDVHEGVSQYASISLDRPFKNHWAYNIAYTRGRATDAQSLGSSTANSQWQFNNIFNQNAVEVGRSDYEIKDRIQASISREFVFQKDYVSTISLYYEGRSGQPFSYVYNSDLNGDGFSGNDLVAVPTGPSDPRFDFSGMTPAQQSAYFAFLNSSGLSRYAGGHAPRNSFFTPWENRLDLSFVQEIPAYRNVKIEFFADFLNLGSFLDKHLFNYIEEINTTTTNSSQLRALGNASYTAAGLIKPSPLTTDANGNVVFSSSSQIAVNSADTRWKIQAGVRLKF